MKRALLQLTTQERLASKQGFSLVEVILTLAIFTLLLTALIGASLVSAESFRLPGERTRALFLAEEGVEAVRSLADADFANLTDGTYGIAIVSGVWTFSGAEDNTGIFTREIAISPIDADRKQISSVVRWQQMSQRSGMAVVDAYITNWKKSVAANRSIRAVEYYVPQGAFTGTTYNLTLNQSLETNYFVIIQGSDGNGTNQGDRGPDENYAALVADPYGTGDLSATGNAQTLSFARGNAVDSWVGVITVVECLDGCATSGFVLKTVEVVVHSEALTSGQDTAAIPWYSLNRAVLFGGFNGAGCYTAEHDPANTKVCHVRLWPTSSDQINWARNDGGGVTLSESQSTVMVVEWGSQWQVQHLFLGGNAGGNRADELDEYDTASLPVAVARNNTWVWGTGYTFENGIGDSAEATLITLGDGVNQNAIENLAALGQEYAVSRGFDIYVLTHDNAQVEHFFKVDGNQNNLIYQVAAGSAAADGRMALMYNGGSATGVDFPRPLWSARYFNNTTIQAERRRYGQAWPAWIQGIDLSLISSTEAPVDTISPDAVIDLAIIDVQPTSVTLSWTAPGDDGNVGTPALYDIRYHTSAIDESNWGASVEVSGEPAPSIAGSTEIYTLGSLSPNTTYYFALKTSDEAQNTSGVSNSPTAATLPPAPEADVLLVDTSGVSAGGGVGKRTVSGITLENTGGLNITIASMNITWTKSPSIIGINVDAQSVWTGAQTSPASSDITDAPLAHGSGVHPLALVFTGNMKGSVMSIAFVMSDSSTKIVSFTP